jgi:hypothetical protein
MSGHRPFKELTKNWPAKRRLRVGERKQILRATLEQGALLTFARRSAYRRRNWRKPSANPRLP